MLEYLTFVGSGLAAVFAIWAWANTESMKSQLKWMVWFLATDPKPKRGTLSVLKRKDD